VLPGEVPQILAAMNLHNLEDTVMGRKIALLALLVVGLCVYAAPAWAPGGNVVTPPQD